MYTYRISPYVEVDWGRRRVPTALSTRRPVRDVNCKPSVVYGHVYGMARGRSGGMWPVRIIAGVHFSSEASRRSAHLRMVTSMSVFLYLNSTMNST